MRYLSDDELARIRRACENDMAFYGTPSKVALLNTRDMHALVCELQALRALRSVMVREEAREAG